MRSRAPPPAVPTAADTFRRIETERFIQTDGFSVIQTDSQWMNPDRRILSAYRAQRRPRRPGRLLDLHADEHQGRLRAVGECDGGFALADEAGEEEKEEKSAR